MINDIKAAYNDKNMRLLFWVLAIPTMAGIVLGFLIQDFQLASVLAGFIEVLAISGILWWKFVK